MLYFLLAFLVMPPELGLQPLVAGFAGLYGLAFFALVAGYFWARWFSIGVGIFGLILSILMMWTGGLEPVFMFVGATHGFVSLVMWGGRMAEHFDGREEWRARFHLDEHGTRRLGKAVIRVGISLPFLIAYGLAPNPEPEGILLAAVVGLVGVGFWGLVRARTWGVLVMMVAGATVLISLATTTQIVPLGSGSTADISFEGIMGGSLLLYATLPFTLPIVRFLRG